MNPPTEWQCQRCTLLNALALAHCAACETPRPFALPFTPQNAAAAVVPPARPPPPAVAAVQPSNGFILPFVSSAVARIDSALDVLVDRFAPTGDANADWLCPRCNRTNDPRADVCGGCRLSKQIERSFFKWRCERCTLRQAEAPIDSKCPVCGKKSAAARPLPLPPPNLQGTLDKRAHYPHVPIEPAEEDSRECARVYEKIVQFCRRYQQSFIDDQFPHSDRSIGDLRALDRSNLSIVWLRPQNIVTKDGRKCRWSLFNDPRPADIEQGLLGNCWFISALALIAERPEILERILISKNYESHGVYQIRLCIDGLWKTVVVDDFFPCHATKKTMIFAVGRNNQLWVSLIEKALAKMYGSYSRLRAGRMHEGLATLVGCPCQTLDIDAGPRDEHHLDFLWAQLLSSNDELFLMGASCGAGRNAVNAEEYKGLGLMAAHAYSILDVKQLGARRLIRLKNPWGNFVWSGEFAPSWTGWTPELRARLDSGGHASGTFWMPFEAFCTYFDAVDIARLNMRHAVRWPVNIGWDPRRCACLRLVVTERTEVFISLFQKSRMGTDDLDLLLCVHREDAAGADVCLPGELVAKSERRVHASVNVEDLFLQPGNYVVYAHSLMKATDGFVQSGSIVVFSSKPVFTEVFPAHHRYMRRSLEQMMAKHGRIESSLPNCTARVMTTNFAGLMVMIENSSPKHCLQVKSDCVQSTNVVSTRGTLTTFDSIPPLHRQIVTILTHMEASQAFSVRHRLDVRLVNRPQLGDMFTPSPSAQNAPGFQSEQAFALHAPTAVWS
ncbi:hypothetical protein M3Y99_01364100 [Aphelenchoides fujianensis]|nr:hypothetical protein M3Y99_01364100 [Aphelenchoides fujianensis]